MVSESSSSRDTNKCDRGAALDLGTLEDEKEESKEAELQVTSSS